MIEALPLVDAAMRGALAATALLLGTAFLRGGCRHPARRMGAALMAGLVVQSFASLPLVEQGWPMAWQAPLIGLSLGNVVLFWLLTRALFDDEFAIDRAAVRTWAAVVAVGLGFGLSMSVFGPRAWPTLAFTLVLRWVPAAFALLVIAAAASHWRADLIETRRRLRVCIVVAGSLYTLSTVALRLASRTGALSADAARFDAGALLLITFLAAALVLRMADADLFAEPVSLTVSAASSTAPVSNTIAESALAMPMRDVALHASPDAVDDSVGVALDQLMTREQAWRIDDLTLGLLALKLGVPEYRLRRFINLRLGHRNFNAYINGLRLAEARAALADPARRADSVLAIAMAAGFASIGPFNRAFKATSGVTPSEFRRGALPDS